MTGVAALAAVLAALAAPPLTATRERALLATWLGGPGKDTLTSATILADGSGLVGGMIAFDKLKLLKPARAVAGVGDGIVARVIPTETDILAVQRFSGTVADLDSDADGGTYITGDFGSIRVSARGQTIWMSNVGGPSARISVGPSGGAFVLSGKTLTSINSRGHAARQWDIPAAFVSDVEWDPETSLVFVTGFDNQKGHKGAVEAAFVYAYDAQGKQAWKAYGWSGVELDDEGLMADTRGCRLAMGKDGRLYVAGESAGASTLWTRMPQDLKAKADLVKADKYQDPAGADSTTLTFIGRLDTKTGHSEGGTLLLGRLPDGKASAMRPRALAVSADGRIFVGGAAAAGAPISEGAITGQTPVLRSSGAAAAEGGEGGAFLVIFDLLFRRLYATTLCDGQTNAVAVAPTYVIAVGDGEGGLVTERPLQADAGGEVDGWIVILPMRLGPAVRPAPTPPLAPLPFGR